MLAAALGAIGKDWITLAISAVFFIIAPIATGIEEKWADRYSYLFMFGTGIFWWGVFASRIWPFLLFPSLAVGIVTVVVYIFARVLGWAPTKTERK